MKVIISIALVIASLLAISTFFDHDYTIINNPPAGESIVSFGDSLTYGTGARKGMDYPTQLSLLINEPVINKGKPGDTTSSALKRLDEVLQLNPRIVLITLGGNDLKNGEDRKTAFKNLKTIIQRIQDTGAMVVIGGIDVPLFGRGFAESYEELAIETGSVLVPNVFENIMGKSQLMNDQIHPNDQGYTIMAQHFYSVVKPYL